MANKGFGVKEINLIGSSGTPTIESPGNLNINANTVAISTNVTIGGDVTSNVNVTGVVTATSFDGDVTGTATTATNLADGANITTGIITSARLGSGIDAAKFLRGDGTWQTVSTGGASGLWESNATGINTSTYIGIRTTTASSALTVDGDGRFTGVVSATTFRGLSGSDATFIGDGSGLTGVTASGTGIVIRDDGNLVGTAGTINFGNNLSVTSVSGAAVTVTYTETSTLDNVLGRGNVSGIGLSVGVVTATSFDGDVTGTATTATNAINFGITNSSSEDKTTYPVFVDGIQGNEPGEVDTGFTYNPSTGTVSATVFSGSGASLTSLNASNISTGIVTAARLGSGVDAAKFLRGDNTWQIVSSGGAGGLWESNATGINTSTNVGIGTTNPITPLQINQVHGLATGIGTYNASAGVTTDIDSFSISSFDFKTVEYTLHFENASNIQSQKVLVMKNATTAYSQEYSIMYHPERIVSIGATVDGGNLKIQSTAETGISGLTTYRFVRGSLL